MEVHIKDVVSSHFIAHPATAKQGKVKVANYIVIEL